MQSYRSIFYILLKLILIPIYIYILKKKEKKRKKEGLLFEFACGIMLLPLKVYMHGVEPGEARG